MVKEVGVMQTVYADQAGEPWLGGEEFREYLIPDSLKGEQIIVARFITQFQTATSFYRFFKSPGHPPQAYMWMMVPAPFGPGFVHRLLPFDSWKDLEFAVGDLVFRDLIRCLAEGSIGIISN
jgi:hypothetical protein